MNVERCCDVVVVVVVAAAVADAVVAVVVALLLSLFQQGNVQAFCAVGTTTATIQQK